MNETNRSAMQYAMVVIDSGVAGHHGAIQAARLGKKVAVVERSIALGGASVNTGTIRARHFGSRQGGFRELFAANPDARSAEGSAMYLRG